MEFDKLLSVKVALPLKVRFALNNWLFATVEFIVIPPPEFNVSVWLPANPEPMV